MITSDISFADLGLAEPLMRAIADAGYTHPTPIQAQAIPQVLKGGDLLAAAQTGTGKTAGFTLPLLHLLSSNRPAQMRPGRPRCLILTPTRELTAQVEESVQIYGKYLPLKSMVMFGGVNINPQISALKKPVDILVATPGRLLDHVGQKTLDLSGVEILVLDEADRMLDMGFIRDIRKILALLPAKRQNLLFSATFSDDIRALAKGVLNDPGEVSVARRNTASELVRQSVLLVQKEQKRDLLSHLVRSNGWKQVLVFTRTKHGANRLAEKLVKDGVPAAAIHGNKSQSARTKALAGFKDGSVEVLVATDIAARGLDIDQLPQVVNFELPNVPEDYVHRIGRTGRAGATGAAVSLVDGEEGKLLADIEKLIKRKIDREPLPAFTVSAPDRDERAERPPRSHAPRQGQGRQGAPRDGGRGQSAHGSGGRQPSGSGRGQGAARGQGPASRPAASQPSQARPAQPRHAAPASQGAARPAGEARNGGARRPALFTPKPQG